MDNYVTFWKNTNNDDHVLAKPYVQLGAKARNGKIVAAENYELDEIVAEVRTRVNVFKPNLKITIWDVLTGKWKDRIEKYQECLDGNVQWAIGTAINNTTIKLIQNDVAERNIRK